MVKERKEGNDVGPFRGSKVPRDKIALYLLRTKASHGKQAAWWPQIKFPDGPYAFAFAV